MKLNLPDIRDKNINLGLDLFSPALQQMKTDMFGFMNNIYDTKPYNPKGKNSKPLSQLIKDVTFDMMVKNPSIVLHGSSQLSLMGLSKRKPGDIDIFAPKMSSLSVAKTLERKIDAAAGRNAVHVKRVSVPGSDAPFSFTKSKTLYKVEPINGEGLHIDVLGGVPSMPLAKWNTSKGVISIEDPNVSLMKAKSRSKSDPRPEKKLKAKKDIVSLNKYFSKNGVGMSPNKSFFTSINPIPLNLLSVKDKPVDSDKDGIRDVWDCDPFDPNRQGPILDRFKSLIKRKQPKEFEEVSIPKRIESVDGQPVMSGGPQRTVSDYVGSAGAKAAHAIKERAVQTGQAIKAQIAKDDEIAEIVQIFNAMMQGGPQYQDDFLSMLKNKIEALGYPSLIQKAFDAIIQAGESYDQGTIEALVMWLAQNIEIDIDKSVDDRRQAAAQSRLDEEQLRMQRESHEMKMRGRPYSPQQRMPGTPQHFDDGPESTTYELQSNVDDYQRPPRYQEESPFGRFVVPYRPIGYYDTFLRNSSTTTGSIGLRIPFQSPRATIKAIRPHFLRFNQGY